MTEESLGGENAQPAAPESSLPHVDEGLYEAAQGPAIPSGPPTYAPQPLLAAAPRSKAGLVIAALTAALTLLAGIGIGFVMGRRDGSNRLPTMGRGYPGPFGVPGQMPGGQMPGYGGEPGSGQMPGPGSFGMPGLGGVQQSLSPVVRATAAKVATSVVDINTLSTSTGFSGGPTHPYAAGTGMIVSSSGEVLTNNHVIQGAIQIEVTIPGHSGQYQAQVLGVDPTADIALLQIQNQPSNLPAVSIGDASKLSVGSGVIAIGNALGKGGSPSVTAGTVTGLGRSIKVNNDRGGFENLTGMIQSSATVLPGDSGGAMVDTSGQVVGMITASSSPNTAAGGVSFAIPVGTALTTASQIQAGQSSSTVYIGPVGYLGVGVVNFQAHAVSGWKVPPQAGALVIGVAPGSPAAKAGISRGAVIVAVDGTQISSPTDLEAPIHIHRPGDTVSVTWVDRSGKHTANVVLISGPAA